MLSLRLKQIALFVSEDDFVLDVGTDHAYLPIYLKENHLCLDVYASDVASGAIEIAKKNIAKKNMDIKLFLTDGINGIPKDYNTLIISGMGSHTIIDILKNQDLPDKMIISSHNDLYLLRKYINNLGFKIAKEEVIYENNKYYDIILYQKGKEHLNQSTLLYGKGNNQNYYTYLLKQKKNLIKKVHFKEKLCLLKEIYLLKKKIK